RGAFMKLFLSLCMVLVTGLAMVGEARGQTLPGGLVAYYPFNGDASDASGNGNNGIATNVTFSADLFGRQSAFFAGNAYSYVRVPNNPELFGTSGFSVSLWAYIENGGASNPRLFSKGWAFRGPNAAEAAVIGTGPQPKQVAFLEELNGAEYQLN